MFLLLFIYVFKCLCHVIIIFIQRYIDVFFMVKNHIFFYIHNVMIVCSAFWGCQRRTGCADHMRRMRCPGDSPPQYSVFSF